MKTWRERAKDRLKDIGKTQDWLSEQFEMTPGGMQKWLAGTRQPAIDDINRIADLLECPRTWLTHGIAPEETTDGLPDTSQRVLRTLIRLERTTPLPASFWAAVQAMAQAVEPPPQPQPPVIDMKSEDAPRSGTEG